MYFTDRGIEELEDRRGDEEVTMSWLAERLRDFVDLNPEFEVPVDRLASWLARLDDDQDLLSRTSRGACLPDTYHGDLASGLGQDGCLVPVLVLRGLWCTAVTDDARPMPVHTMWMPRSCRQVCMVAASTSYGSGARVMPGAGVLGLVAGVVGPCAGVVGPCAGAVGLVLGALGPGAGVLGPGAGAVGPGAGVAVDAGVGIMTEGSGGGCWHAICLDFEGMRYIVMCSG